MSKSAIYLGSMLRNANDDGLCTAGAFAQDSEGNQYVLTARVAFSRGGERSVFAVDTGMHIGELLDQDHMVDERLPFAKTIGAIRLRKDVEIAWGKSENTPIGSPIARTGDLLGRAVERFSCRGCVGSIVSTFGLVRLSDKFDGAATVYFDVLEGHFAESQPLPRGTAGELIVTTAGEPIGLGIAGTPDRYFIAPLAPALDDYGFQLLWPPQKQRKPSEEISKLIADWDIDDKSSNHVQAAA